MLTFPRGSSGFGLILLRLTTSWLLVAIACNDMPWGDAGLLSLSAVILAIFLALGLFTIVTASLAAALCVTLALLHHQESLAAGAATFSMCIALALLGAGAYSMDARLFGQRRVVWQSR